MRGRLACERSSQARERNQGSKLRLESREPSLSVSDGWIDPSVYRRGKPTRFAPRPKPAPWRAVRPMLGARRSRSANVTAATIATARISSTLSFFCGMMNVARATARPSRKYLIARVTSSVTVKPSILIIWVPKIFVSGCDHPPG